MTVPNEKVLAAATGSYGGLGKIGTLAATTGVAYVCATATPHHDLRAYWRVQSDNAHTLTFYRARSRVDAPTITLSSMADTENATINGLTITAEATAADAAWASRKFYTGGTDAQDAAQLAALINADNTITPNGSVNVGDTITVTTTCDETNCPGHTYTYTAAAAPDYDDRVFDQSGNQAAELASIVLALNHRRNVTLASCAAGTTISVTIPGVTTYTFTAHATTTTAASRQFSISGTNSQDGDELVTCLNDATYGLGTDYTAANAAGVVSITRNRAGAPEPVLSSSNATTAACVNVAGGVPGVLAAATGATGELALTPTWVKTIAVTTSNGTRLATSDIDVPGIYASAADAVVTLTPRTPGSPTGGEKASVIYSVTGTAATHWAVDQAATLLGLTKDYWNTAVTGITANNTTAGTLYKQDNAEGWPYLYLGVSNTEGDAGTYVVGCTLV